MANVIKQAINILSETFTLNLVARAMTAKIDCANPIYITESINMPLL